MLMRIVIYAHVPQLWAGVAMDTITAISLILSIVGASIAVLGLLFKISEKLSRIQENTGKIEDVKTEVTKLATGVDVVIRYGLQTSKGTVTVTLPQLGRVSVSAQPGSQSTEYKLEFTKTHHVLDHNYISKKTKELGFAKTEIVMFGKESQLASLGPNLMVLVVPSTDPKLCSDYVSAFLKFIDSLLEGYAEELKEYENIKV
jgi:hypothetical protein